MLTRMDVTGIIERHSDSFDPIIIDSSVVSDLVGTIQCAHQLLGREA